jgi:hypothetical protein
MPAVPQRFCTACTALLASVRPLNSIIRHQVMVAEVSRTPAARLASIVVDLVFAIAFLYFWIRGGSAAYLFLMLSFLLRTPVSFHRPFDWNMFARTVFARRRFTPPMSRTTTLFSVASLVLLVIGIVMFAVNQLQGLRAGV